MVQILGSWWSAIKKLFDNYVNLEFDNYTRHSKQMLITKT